ncbi:hypothetical protein PRIC1_010345 [Phytophthora ramorum]
MRVTPVLLVAIGAACGAVAKALDENDTQLELMAADDDEPICYWPMGLDCLLDRVDNNLKLGEANKCDLPVPIPTDNYVADLRRNKYDDPAKKVASQQPFIQLTATLQKEGTVSTPKKTKKTSWYQYVTNPTLVQSEIVFDAPGTYSLSIVANDYNHEVSCIGCVAILDMFRPRFGSACSCPTPLMSPQTLTTTSLTAFQNYDTAYKNYVADNNVVNNPNSGSLCKETSADGFSKRTLFYESENDCYTSCFDSTTFGTIVSKLKSNLPFPASLQTAAATLESSLNLKCKWSCRKKRTLKENYTPYECPSDYESEPHAPDSICTEGTGIPTMCSIDVSLEAKGTDIIAASVTINSIVQAASRNVLDALPSKPAGSDPVKNVYYSIPCTTFDKTNANCQYTTKLSQLLTVTTEFVTAFPTPTSEAANSKNFVSWRYNKDGTTFVKWDPLTDTTMISFTDASTTIVLEAWTACGRAYTTTFTVNLFLHSTLACSKFDTMWTVVEKPGVQGTEGTYCAYGGSDFAVLKLNMAVADVLQQASSTVTGTYTGVKCDIMVKETGGPDKQVVTFVDDQTSATINKYYGVELVTSPTTAQKTTGVIHCKFTRTPRSNSLMLASAATGDNNTLDCGHTFTIMDCDQPELNLGQKEDVCADACAGDTAPGMLEACGGSIVTSSDVSTTLKPSTPQTCCSKCTKALTCSSVGTTDVMRCEPSPTPLLMAEVSEMADREKSSLASSTTTLLLGASALVAVVALVVIKRRSTATRAGVEQDAYYAFLE